jgi:hypothetical protein
MNSWLRGQTLPGRAIPTDSDWRTQKEMGGNPGGTGSWPQPPGNAAWENEVACSLSNADRHVARFEFGACDVGAPYIRRRVFLVACTSLSRLEIARSALTPAIESVKKAADAQGDWEPDKLAALRVDASSAGEMDRSESSAVRRERIEALGDSNSPHMAEVIGRAIMKATGAES